MASEVRVNQIQNRSGLGTITVADSGVVISGITTISDLRTSGGALTVGTGASISSPATNVLTLGTNNSESVRINSSGNFGLGTNDPQVRLDVRQDSSSTTTMAGIRVQNTNITGDSQSGISFFNYDNFGAKIYTLRTGSPQGVLVFATNNGNGIAESNVIERLRIDSSGRVTMPYQPAFSASGANTNVNYSGGAIFQFNVADLNVGNHFDTSNYRFTAPVTGFYLFGAAIYVNGNLSACFTVNGSQVYGGADPQPLLFTNTTSITISGQIQLSLAAGDIVDFRSRDGAASNSIYMGHSNFWGRLVG